MRPDSPRGTWIVLDDPSAGPAMETSGAGLGGDAPWGHAVNVPASSTWPSLPLPRSTPST